MKDKLMRDLKKGDSVVFTDSRPTLTLGIVTYEEPDGIVVRDNLGHKHTIICYKEVLRL